MLSLWNHLHPQTPDESKGQESDFCPSEDLWLKIAKATPQQTKGTLSFSQNVIEHFLETEDTTDNK
ncbi:MAG: hypothetical protein AAGE84_29415 [Cyanobacteria bacterium P01_G01_bin.39]